MPRLLSSLACWCLMLVTACASAGGDDGVDAAPPECAAGETRTCYPGVESEIGVGICRAGMQTCEDGRFGACIGAIPAETRETCGDMVDNDCNSDLDNGCPCTYTKSTGFTSNGKTVCCNDPGTLLTVNDCGSGSNHTAQKQGQCGVAIEGSNNGGSPCASITCTGTLEAATCQ